MVRTILAALVAAGCGGASYQGAGDWDAAEPADDAGAALDAGAPGRSQLALYRSGTRLRARVARSPDGAQTWLGWHDAERGEDCVVRRAGDGRLRCLPGPLVASAWSDAACSVPIVLRPLVARDCAPPTIVVMADAPDMCVGGEPWFRVYEVGVAAREVEGDAYAVDPLRGCRPLFGDGAHALAYSATEIPPTRYVELIEATE